MAEQQQQQQLPHPNLRVYPRTPTQPSDSTTAHENNHVQLVDVTERTQINKSLPSLKC